jgi:hypothetical protein
LELDQHSTAGYGKKKCISISMQSNGKRLLICAENFLAISEKKAGG